MRTVKVGNENVRDFIAYCSAFAPEHDESFIPGEDFKPRPDEPAFLLVDNKGKPEGAVSLMLHPEYRAVKKGRFRIFHSTGAERDSYRTMLDSVLPLAEGIESIYCFIGEHRTAVRKIWEELGFNVSRYSYIFERRFDSIEQPMFPDGYSLKKFETEKDEQAWCEVVNRSFADIKGHRPMYPSKIAEWRKEKGYLDEGMRILWHTDKPVGTVHMESETENGEDILFIQALSVLPEYQGKGLGRNLLRASLEFGKLRGFSKAMLSVNAENEKAVELYLKEGFINTDTVVCYSLGIK